MTSRWIGMRWALAAAAATLLLPMGAVLAEDDEKPEKEARREIVREAFSDLTGTRARLGVVLQPMTDGLRNYFKVEQGQGVLVGDVMENSAAAKAGIAPGDVILSVDGKKVSDMFDLVRIIRDRNPGEKVSIHLMRERAETTLEATLDERPKGKFDWRFEGPYREFSVHPMVPHEDMMEARRAVEEARREAMDAAREALQAQREALGAEQRAELSEAMRGLKHEMKETIREAMEELRRAIREIREEMKGDKKGDL